MIRFLTDRFSNWYNRQGETKQLRLYFSFCLLFLALLGLSIRYIHFNAAVYTAPKTSHIGKASGQRFKDSITTKKQ